MLQALRILPVLWCNFLLFLYFIIIIFRPLLFMYRIHRVAQKSKPLPNYQKIVLNVLKSAN